MNPLIIDKTLLLENAAKIAELEQQCSLIYGRPLKVQLVEAETHEVFCKPTEEVILKTVCEHFNIEIDQLQGKVRTQNITDARAIFLKLLKMFYPDLSLKKLGVYLGNRDHSTVINSLKQFDSFYQNDTQFKNAFDFIKIKLLANDNRN